MSNADMTNYGMGEYAPRQGLDRTRYVRPSEARPRQMRTRIDMREPDPAMAQIKVVTMLCALALAVLAIGIVMWVFDAVADAEAKDGPIEIRAASPASNVLGAADEKPATPQSTPRTEWRQGVLPRLFQTDAEWSGAPYADGTVATHGCGPTCLSMVYVALTGQRDLDPHDMAEFSELNGFIDQGVTSWLLMSQGAALVGLDSTEVPASAQAIEGHLLAGEPVICSVHEGDFTDEGHFIVLAGMNSDGTVEIRDPNSEDRTDTPWDLGRVISQCDNIWAFSA